MNQSKNESSHIPKTASGENEESILSEMMKKPEFAEFEEISKILQLMNSLDTGAKTSYRTYISGDTAG